MDYLPLELVDITSQEAFACVNTYHRHHWRPVNAIAVKGLVCKGEMWLRGAVILNRPVARLLDNGETLEVVRLVVAPNTPNGCSMLYGWARREAKKRGYKRLITYILDTESGVSLRAAGWVCTLNKAGGGSWSRPSRPHRDKAPLNVKQRYEAIL